MSGKEAMGKLKTPGGLRWDAAELMWTGDIRFEAGSMRFWLTSEQAVVWLDETGHLPRNAPGGIVILTSEEGTGP